MLIYGTFLHCHVVPQNWLREVQKKEIEKFAKNRILIYISCKVYTICILLAIHQMVCQHFAQQLETTSPGCQHTTKCHQLIVWCRSECVDQRNGPFSIDVNWWGGRRRRCQDRATILCYGVKNQIFMVNFRFKIWFFEVLSRRFLPNFLMNYFMVYFFDHKYENVRKNWILGFRLR